MSLETATVRSMDELSLSVDSAERGVSLHGGVGQELVLPVLPETPKTGHGTQTWMVGVLGHVGAANGIFEVAAHVETPPLLEWRNQGAFSNTL